MTEEATDRTNGARAGKRAHIIHLAGPRMHTSEWKHTILLIHGIGGRKLLTWQSRSSSNPWYKTLAKKSGASVYAVRLRYRKLAWQSSERLIEEYSHDLVDLLKDIHVLKRHATLIGHSLGGIVLKCFLLDALGPESDEYFSRRVVNIRAAIFLAVPHRGSPWASRIWGPLISTAHRDLVPNSRFLKFLQRRFVDLCNGHRNIALVTVHEGPTSVARTLPRSMACLASIAKVVPDFIVVPSNSSRIGVSHEFEINTVASHKEIAKFEYPGADTVLNRITAVVG